MLQRLKALFAKRAARADPRDYLATEVEGFVRTLPGVTSVRRVEGEFALDIHEGKTESRMFLENLFLETRDMSPEQRRERIAFVCRGLRARAEGPSWGEARATFVPVLRGATYGLQIWAKDPEADFVRKPFLPFLDLLVAEDREESMSFVSQRSVKNWGVRADDVFAAAAQRMHLLADPVVELYDDTHGPLWHVTSDDSYEASRLLIPGWLASFAGKVEGRPIAIVPERSTVMVGGDARPEMIERLLEKAEREFAASPRRISPALYTVDDAGRVVPYEREGNDSLAVRVRTAHVQLAGYEYDTQKEVLNSLYAAKGEDWFVVEYRCYQLPDGSAHSVGVWTEGVRSLLPRTDFVALIATGSGEPRVVEVPFEKLASRLKRAANLHPERFETGAFPDPDELRALQATAA